MSFLSRRQAMVAALALLAVLSVVALLSARGSSANESEDLWKLKLQDSFLNVENPLSHEQHWSPLAWANAANKTGAVETAGAGWGPTNVYPAITGAYWDAEQFGANGNGQAVAVNESPYSGDGRYSALWINMPDPASTKSGYQLSIIYRATGTVGYEASLSKWTNGGSVIVASKSGLKTNGRIALSYKAGVVTASQADEATGNYVPILTYNDSTYKQGFVGIEASGTVVRLKEFRAAEFAPFIKPGTCPTGDRFYGGECWEIAYRVTKVNAREAASECGRAGGHLPTVLGIQSFTNDSPGVAPIHPEGEWTGELDLIGTTDGKQYAFATVRPGNLVPPASPTELFRYRCVFPAPTQ